MNNRVNKPVIINGRRELRYIAIAGCFAMLFIGFFDGFEVLHFYIPVMIVLFIISYPFRRIAEISPEFLVIRRNFRKFGKVTTFRMDEIRSAATEQSLYHYTGGNRDTWLILHFKDGRVEKVFLGINFNKHALEDELGKYVEIFTPNFWEL